MARAREALPAPARDRTARPHGLLLGAHLPIAGGHIRALEEARRLGFGVMAMFVRQHRQWRPAPPLTPQTARDFRRLRRQLRIKCIVAHGSYLVNLAGEGEFRTRSIRTMSDELERCRLLGIEYLNIHGGSCPDPRTGIANLAEALNSVVGAAGPDSPRVLLETTAGQGHSLGASLEELADMLDRLRPSERFGVCLDTCHVFAAGYDVRTRESYERLITQFDELIGLNRLKAIHLNDSMRPCGSRVDRHAHIGQGLIGLDGLSHFVNDARLRRVPMLLETPKGTDDAGRDWDAVNAQTILSLVRRRGKKPRGRRDLALCATRSSH